MSKTQKLANQPKRRSQRRKSKLAYNQPSQYAIPNPYQSLNTCKQLPHTLIKKLTKFQSLSLKSLRQIEFKSEQLDRNMCIQQQTKLKDTDQNIDKLAILTKMKKAASSQQQKYQKMMKENCVKLISDTNSISQNELSQQEQQIKCSQSQNIMSERLSFNLQSSIGQKSENNFYQIFQNNNSDSNQQIISLANLVPQIDHDFTGYDAEIYLI